MTEATTTLTRAVALLAVVKKSELEIRLAPQQFAKCPDELRTHGAHAGNDEYKSQVHCSSGPSSLSKGGCGIFNGFHRDPMSFSSKTFESFRPYDT